MFKLKWERFDDKDAILHCEVYEWNIKVARELDKAADDLFDYLESQGYERCLTLSPNPRFCEYMGGIEFGVYEHEGIEYRGFRWELK